MAHYFDTLVVRRVIGDVVDMFVPSITVNVYFANKQVTNGCDIKPSFATNPPRVTISGNPDSLYTMVMTDPDAPSPSEPSMREWVHWIVTNIPGGTGPSEGNEVLSYMGPCPPLGIHRYILVFFSRRRPWAKWNPQPHGPTSVHVSSQTT